MKVFITSFRFLKSSLFRGGNAFGSSPISRSFASIALGAIGFIGSALGGGVALLEAEALGPLEADALAEGVTEGTLEAEGAVVAGVFGPP